MFDFSVGAWQSYSWLHFQYYYLAYLHNITYLQTITLKETNSDYIISYLIYSIVTHHIYITHRCTQPYFLLYERVIFIHWKCSLPFAAFTEDHIMNNDSVLIVHVIHTYVVLVLRLPPYVSSMYVCAPSHIIELNVKINSAVLCIPNFHCALHKRLRNLIVSRNLLNRM